MLPLPSFDRALRRRAGWLRGGSLVSASAALLFAACAPVPPPSARPPVAAPAASMRYAEAADGFALGAPPDPARKARFAALTPKLDAMLAKMAEDDHTPGLGVGIVLDGEIVYAKGFGYRDRAAKAPFDADTVFRVASVTKSFVAMAILELRDEGKLRLDEPAATYYPPLARLAYPTRDSAPITVRDLLTHASGLPEDNYWVDGAGEVPEAKLAALVASGMRFSRAPGSDFEYSNTAFAILGQILANVTGMPAREYVREAILQPLGMTSSGFSPDEVARDHLATGYRGESGYHTDDGADVVAPAAPLGAYETAGGLYSTIHDMARYVAFQLSAWPPRNAPETGPVRRSTVREMQQGVRRANPFSFPKVMLPSRQPAVVRVRGEGVSLFSYGYGYGFFTAATCDDDFYVHHDGELPGYETGLALYPARGYGIVSFVNDERTSAYPPDDVTELLRDGGVIDVLEPAPVPALDAARDAVDALFAQWDAGRAEQLFDPTFWRYQSEDTFRGQLAALASAHGACRADDRVHPTNLTRGRWRLACERGDVTFVAVLSPDTTGRLQTLLWEDSLPPTARLARAAETVASWTRAWDEAAAHALLAPAFDAAALKKTLAHLSLDHGECHLDRALTSDGATKARFRLACAEGAVELALTVDPKTEKLTSVRATLPRTRRNCAR